MSDRIRGFEPVFDVNSRLLILGSFPSVKSRKVDFYYGNKQNRFWKILFGFFGEEVQESTAAKREFLLRRGIALWDVVAECEIVGSQDSTIRNYAAADIGRVLSAAPVEKIFLNGKTALAVFRKTFPEIGVPYECLPSTSPANTRCDENVWRRALAEMFPDKK